MSAFLFAVGAVVAFYATMAIVIAVTAFTREARERAEFWRVSREAAQWKAALPRRIRQKIFARLREV